VLDHRGLVPKVTGTRTGTISILTTGSTGATILNLTGVGVSADGPTPISVNTPATGIPCVNGVCDTGLTTIVNDFYYTAFSAGGDTSATPLVCRSRPARSRPAPRSSPTAR